MCTELHFSEGILWCYSEKSTVLFRELAALRKDILLHEGIPENLRYAQGKGVP
jgi:hypothetical protein